MPQRGDAARITRDVGTGAWDTLRRHLLGVPQPDQVLSLPSSLHCLWPPQGSLHPAQDRSHLVLPQEAHMGLGRLLGIVLSEAFQRDGAGPGERNRG